MNTIKGYFSLLNQLQIEGDAAEIQTFFHHNDLCRKEVDRIERGREDFVSRHAKPVKCKTIIRNIQILSEDRAKVDLVLNNYLWKLYHIDHHFFEQEDEQCHQIRLQEKNGNWYIESDFLIGSEGSGNIRQMEPQGQEDPVNLDLSANQGSGSYNRAKVKRYAEIWWNQYNPTYPKFEVDCTNYVSQCLHAGGLPMEFSKNRSTGWWVQGKANWSYSWSVANSLMIYLAGGNPQKRRKAELKSSADQLMVGDVICYDWNGDGNYQHNTIVVSKDANGMPLVNAHTTNSRHRYWEYRDSHAWTKNTQYKFIHILG